MASRKGQYMAIEAVLSIGLSLVVAVAAIGVFGTYRDSVMDTVADREVSVIKSQVITAAYNLRNTGDGSSITVNLPDSGPDYQYSMGGGKFVISADGNNYELDLNGFSWVNEFRGSAEGSTVKIVKLEDDVVLRSG